MEKYLTTAKITKKELAKLLSIAKERKRNVETKRKGDVDNIYVDGNLFAESMKGYCNLIIYI